MASEKENSGCLELTAIAADWDYRVSKPGTWSDNPRLSSIEFHPGAASDRLIVRQGDGGGPIRFDSGAVDNAGDARIKYFHGIRCIPFVSYSECTFSAGHSVIIELWRES